MSKANEFLKSEKNSYGKIFVDINYAIDNVSPFLDESILKRRKYVAKLPVLKRYIELLQTAECEINKGGFFSKFGNDKYIDLLDDYKRDNTESLSQLVKCSQCQCLNCTANCRFDSCLGCRDNSNIVFCDHKKVNISKPDNFILNLTNNRTGIDDRYVVLGVIQDVDRDSKYIVIENIINKEKFILHYYPGISEDTYGEITNPEEFDFVVSTFQSLE
ncbi:DUF1292 domain-containing protein [Clostridium sp. PL3]|uniref:DUF1292 domain-containing protein n=1 Tax=Clostridium thailandense TaxID=2794346 RepID=A0A949U126_9CLOT|nr:DUF1292 domain-containing protein [Clostridium thailandense]MBV7275410.1 DUF1292 domain-containing protein [Clostridium thailandense]